MLDHDLFYHFSLLQYYRISFGHKKTAKDDEIEMNSYNHDKYNHSSDKISLLQDAPGHQEQHSERNKKKPREPSLFMALVRSFGGDFTVTGVLKFFQDLLNFVSPLLLKYVTLSMYTSLRTFSTQLYNVHNCIAGIFQERNLYRL
jgi:hypothetical protein